MVGVSVKYSKKLDDVEKVEQVFEEYHKRLDDFGKDEDTTYWKNTISNMTWEEYIECMKNNCIRLAVNKLVSQGFIPIEANAIFSTIYNIPHWYYR